MVYWNSQARLRQLSNSSQVSQDMQKRGNGNFVNIATLLAILVEKGIVTMEEFELYHEEVLNAIGNQDNQET